MKDVANAARLYPAIVGDWPIGSATGETEMNVVRALVLSCILAGTAACAEGTKQHGVTGALLDKVMLAESKKMDLLRAEVAMMFLSYVAVDSGERTEADNIATIAALNRTALAIDCMRRIDSPTVALRPKAEQELCGAPTYYFFDTRMVSVDRNLLSLARSSLPTASLSNLLAALPNASVQPLSLVSPILGVARDAAVIGWRGMAVYRDALELEVAVYCGPPALGPDEICKGWRPEHGRDVKKQRQFVDTVLANAPVRFSMAPQEPLFAAARSQTAANCRRLQDKVGSKDTINCLVVLPEA